MPVQQDIEVWRGNSRPVVILPFPDGYVPAPGATYQMVVSIGTTAILVSGVVLVDAIARQFRWPLSTSDSRLIPLGTVASYELEERSRYGEETVLSGFVIGAGGANFDVPLPVGSRLNWTDPGNRQWRMMGWIAGRSAAPRRTTQLNNSDPRNTALRMMGWI